MVTWLEKLVDDEAMGMSHYLGVCLALLLKCRSIKSSSFNDETLTINSSFFSTADAVLIVYLGWHITFPPWHTLAAGLVPLLSQVLPYHPLFVDK